MKIWRIMLMSIVAFCLFVTLSIPTPAHAAKPKWEVKADQVIAEAKKHLNKEYKKGTNGPNTFDCSGYTQYVLKHSIDYGLHRTSKKQATQGKNISSQSIRKGDLLFYNTDGSGISHVAIYIGNNEMIHAASEKTDVTITPINHSYWKPRLVKAQRLLNI